MGTDLNAAYRNIIARQQGAGLPVTVGALGSSGNGQPSNVGIGFDTQMTPLVTFALIGLALYFLTKK